MKVNMARNKKSMKIQEGFTVLDVFVDDVKIGFIQTGCSVEFEITLTVGQKVIVYYDATVFKGYHGFTVT